MEEHSPRQPHTIQLEKLIGDARILIVDDSKPDRKRLGKILMNKGFDIREASNGQEALRIVADYKPDIVLLDVNLPDMSGLEVCGRIRSTPEYDNIPVVFISIMSHPEHKMKGFDAGGDDYIAKPYYPNEIIARVKTHLRLRMASKLVQDTNARLEQMLAERTQNLIRSEREAVFGQLVQGIVHNMRNPLAGIRGYCDFILDDLAKLAPDNECNHDAYVEIFSNLEQRMQKIKHSSRNLSAMIDSLMRKSRSDHAEKFETIDLNEIIRQELAFLQANMFFKHDVEKTIDLSPDRLQINAVPAMISQVFNNLVQNSLDAMYEIPKPHLKISTYKNKDFVNLTVEDNGLGIPEEHLSYIFDPFFTTKPKSRKINDESPLGTGLGLYISREMILMHQGKIDIESQINAGTKLIVQLP